MKTLNFIIILFLLNISFNINAQILDTNWQFDGKIEVDTTQVNNIWDYGVSEKEFLNLRNDSVLITSLTENYPVNNSSSFDFSFDINSIDLSLFIVVDWRHSMDVEPKKDGGYVEVSLDGKKTWHNIYDQDSIEEPIMVWYSDKVDTLPNNQIGYSSKIENGGSGICFGDFYPFQSDTVTLRFTFISDSVDTKQEGWMFYDISIKQVLWDDIEESNTKAIINLQPNPVSTQTKITLPQTWQQANLSLYDLTGKLLIQKNNYTNNQTINISHLPKGNYFLKLNYKDEVVFEKLIKQ